MGWKYFWVVLILCLSACKKNRRRGDEIIEQMRFIMNNPPPDGITGWGILIKRFKAY